MPVVDLIVSMIQSGISSLASYLAAHVLLCLVPAFFIAGAMMALIPKETITRYLGRDASPWLSYPMAALGGFVLAVCSCTILPLFASIYAHGAGLGPAVTFLFVGPAINILAVSYTGVAIGMDIALARIVLSVVFGIGIGVIMAFVYRRDDKAHSQAAGAAFAAQSNIKGAVVIFLLLLLSVLIVGTLRVALLTDAYGQATLPLAADGWQDSLDRLVPFDASQGQEGVSVHGVLLILLLALIGLTSWLGLNSVDEGFTAWTWVALGLIILTLLLAALQITPTAGGLQVSITGRFVAEVIVISAVVFVAWRYLDAYEVQEWLWETWRFVKQIFPLLILGVFLAGVVRVLIPPGLVERIAGGNTFLANLVAVLFGVFMYFPTLVEVPIANMFLELGMHRGPLLAYLIADPALSIQSILITAKVIGSRKTWLYVGLVTVFSVTAGLLFGAWVDGASVWFILLGLVGFLAVLLLTLWVIGRRQGESSVSPGASHASEG